MGINYNPTVVTDGLVFCYDMANTQKSWKGAPATNYISTTPTWGGDGPDQTQFVKGYTEITDPNLMYRGLKTFLWSPGTSLNCYLQSDDIVGGTSTTSTVWTFSCYVRAENRHTITSMGVYMYYPTSDGNELGTIEDVGNGWYRISRTRTGTNSYISLIGFTGFNANVRYYLSGAMLTKDNITVAPLNGNETRTNTQAILDLTGQNTISITGSPTYNTNSITFPNTNTGYLSVTAPSNFRMGTQNFTLSCWLKQLDSNTNVLLEARGTSFVGYLWALNYPSTGQISVNLNYGGTQYVYASSISTLQSGVPQNIVAVIDRTNTRILFYLNGSLWNTVTGVHTSSISPSSGDSYHMGYDAGASTQNYELYSYMHHNRALSAFEVLQNFNALRGRYGI